MLKRGCFAHLKEKMIMKCWLDQYLENILLEDLRHAKGYPLWCGWPLFNQWGQGSKVELVLYCDSHILREFNLLCRLQTWKTGTSYGIGETLYASGWSRRSWEDKRKTNKMELQIRCQNDFGLARAGVNPDRTL